MLSQDLAFIQEIKSTSVDADLSFFLKDCSKGNIKFTYVHMQVLVAMCVLFSFIFTTEVTGTVVAMWISRGVA